MMLPGQLWQLSTRLGFVLAVSIVLLIVDGYSAPPPSSEAAGLSFMSGTDWEVFSSDPGGGPATSLGSAQEVCLNSTVPVTCPAGATSYGFEGTSGWIANLAPIPGAAWVWAPGIGGGTAPADLDEFYFSKEIELPSGSVTGTVSVAADDFAEVLVNGSSVGFHGSTTDITLASVGQSVLREFDVTSFLFEGTNVITVRAQNGPSSYVGTCEPSGCTYAENPAGVAFGVSIEALVHYEIELRAWIPHEAVVDPILPVPLPYEFILLRGLRSQLLTCPLPSGLLTRIDSHFGGDAHSNFDGSYRVLSRIEFDWDGEEISNFDPSGDFGPTSLIFDYRARGRVYEQCTVPGQATTATSSSFSRSTFDFGYRSANPLVFPPVPIDGSVNGFIGEDGIVGIFAETDLFPSHGIRVIRDGVTQLTAITNDVSCLSDREVDGPRGVLLLTEGLTFSGPRQFYVVSPDDVGRVEQVSSGLC